MKVRPDPYGTDAEFNEYLRRDRLKMIGVVIALAVLFGLSWWLS